MLTAQIYISSPGLTPRPLRELLAAIELAIIKTLDDTLDSWIMKYYDLVC